MKASLGAIGIVQQVRWLAWQAAYSYLIPGLMYGSPVPSKMILEHSARCVVVPTVVQTPKNEITGSTFVFHLSVKTKLQ